MNDVHMTLTMVCPNVEKFGVDILITDPDEFVNLSQESINSRYFVPAVAFLKHALSKALATPPEAGA